MTWGLPEWVVLGALREQPRRGSALADLAAAGGELGEIWQLPRQEIDRALAALTESGLVTPGTGPDPSYDLTESGRAAVDEWLRQPVEHVRLLRSHLLLKLALLDRRGLDPTPLARRQRAVIERILLAIESERNSRTGFQTVLLTWRHTNATAALRFLDDIG